MEYSDVHNVIVPWGRSHLFTSSLGHRYHSDVHNVRIALFPGFSHVMLHYSSSGESLGTRLMFIVSDFSTSMLLYNLTLFQSFPLTGNTRCSQSGGRPGNE